MRVWEQFQICSCLVSPQPGCSLQRNANVPRNECSLLVDRSEISRVFWSFGRFAPLYKSGTASLNAEVNERFVKIEAPGVARSIPPDTSISDPRVLQLSRNFKRPKAPSRLYWGRNSKSLFENSQIVAEISQKLLILKQLFAKMLSLERCKSANIL